MPYKRIFLMTLVCLGLGGLVIWDNWPEAKDRRPAPATTIDAPGEVEGGKETAAGLEATDADTGATETADLQLDNPLALIEITQLRNWAERPLFASTRQRPPASVRTPRPTAMRVPNERAPASYDLLGIVRNGDRGIALLRKRGEGTSFRVELGDMIGGWRVAKMEDTSLVLEREDGSTQTVLLTRD